MCRPETDWQLIFADQYSKISKLANCPHSPIHPVKNIGCGNLRSLCFTLYHVACRLHVDIHIIPVLHKCGCHNAHFITTYSPSIASLRISRPAIRSSSEMISGGMILMTALSRPALSITRPFLKALAVMAPAVASSLTSTPQRSPIPRVALHLDRRLYSSQDTL